MRKTKLDKLIASAEQNVIDAGGAGSGWTREGGHVGPISIKDIPAWKKEERAKSKLTKWEKQQLIENGKKISPEFEFVKPEMSEHEQKAVILRNEARRQGYPLDKLDIQEGKGKDFSVSGTQFSEGGHANLQTGVITMYPDTVDRDSQLGPMLAHEIEHQKYALVTYQRTGEDRRFSDMAQHDHVSFDAITKPNGFIDPDNPEAQKQFPVLTALAPFFDGDGYEKLKAEDGVSNYSKSYWAGYGPDPKITLDSAVHETLGEIARIQNYGTRYEMRWNGDYDPTPLWRNLFNTVNSIAGERLNR